MDSGDINIFNNYRIQNNAKRGPVRGGIRFHHGVDYGWNKSTLERYARILDAMRNRSSEEAFKEMYNDIEMAYLALKKMRKNRNLLILNSFVRYEYLIIF